MKVNRRSACLLIASVPALAGRLKDEPNEERGEAWLGPEYWANPLQDWQLRKGRMECVVSGGNRSVYLLTREVAGRAGTLNMSVDLTWTGGDRTGITEGFAGYRVGIKGERGDYRDSAIYGVGLNVGITAKGQLFIGHVTSGAPMVPDFPKAVKLKLEAGPEGGGYRVSVTALDDAGGVLGVKEQTGIAPEWLEGGLALVCHAGAVRDSPDRTAVRQTANGAVIADSERGGNVRFAFQNWEVSGSKLDSFEERAFGPLLWAMHTVSRGVLKLTAQLTPVDAGSEQVRLQIEDGEWKTVASAPVDGLSRTATFRVPEWRSTVDVPYRVAYSWKGEHTFEGVIRRDPVDQQRIVFASLSCLNDYGFPHSDLLASLQRFKPDVIAFQGDQIYERAGGFGIQRLPLETATLDYLRKWYLFGWSFRDLMRDTPTICMPDDHDVFHGNVWGAGGRHAEGAGYAGQDSGGYMEPAKWVNMMQRTQTSHLPDPYDATPVEQDIGVYYTELVRGGVSFAILEDRKWKSAPKVVLPKARIVNGWAQNPEYDAARDGDVAGAELFGPRQLRFLDAWGEDWRNGVWMKVALSQTLMANIATLPPPANTDEVVPSLPIPKTGEYVEHDVLVADHDSNAWPQSGRNRALRSLRRCSAVHLCGDQHLGSTIQYGVEDWGDAAYALCSPALSNIFPRRWYPSTPGTNPKPHSPRNTGEYRDGFGNKLTIHAVFNPGQAESKPNPLLDRSTGFAMVAFDRADHSITLAVWPRRGGAREPVPGWPIKIDALDNGWSRTGWVLKEVHADGREDFCVQVRASAGGEIVYTLRVKGTSFRPPVPREGIYSVRVFDPDSSYEKEIEGQRSVARIV